MIQRMTWIKRNYSVGIGWYTIDTKLQLLNISWNSKVYINKGFIIFKLQSKLQWWSHSVEVLYDYINIRNVMIITYQNNVNISELT